MVIILSMRRITSITLGAVVLLSVARQASAGDFRICENQGTVIIPADGSVDVPLNAGIFMQTDGYAPRPVLEREDGTVVPVEDIETGHYYADECFYPRAPVDLLEPETTYVLRLDGNVVSTFTTGTEEDNEPPEVTIGDDQDDRGRFSATWEGSDDFVLVIAQGSYSDGTCDIVAAPSADTIELTLCSFVDGSEDFVVFDHAWNATEVSAISWRVDEGCACATSGDRSSGAPLALLIPLTFLALRRARRR